MTTYDPVEQEEALRAWWQRHGKNVLTGIALALAVIVGVQWWLDQQRIKRENAAILYTQMMDRLDKDAAQAQSLAGKLMEEYADTPYAAFAALAVARLEAEGGKLDAAAQRLRWALERAGFLSGGEDLVRLRLARVQLAQGQAEQALATLGRSRRRPSMASPPPCAATSTCNRDSWTRPEPPIALPSPIRRWAASSAPCCK